MNGFERASRHAALLASAALAMVGLVGGAVRVLPWLLDPSVPWQVAAPFARSLACVALEVALLVGWPVGWSLAAFRLVESGEARVLASLGERPAATVLRLAPQAVLFCMGLAAAALVYGRDASAPGRIATELVTHARASCSAAPVPRTYAIPFTGLTWLCAPGREPRLVGSLPGAGSAILSARDARIAGDFRSIEVSDARLLFGETPRITVQVASMALHGLAPWAQASSLPPWLRALVFCSSAAIAAAGGALAVLRGRQRTRLGALAFAAAAPLAALAVARVLERGARAPVFFLMVPLASGLVAGLPDVLPSAWSRLRAAIQTASKRARV